MLRHRDFRLLRIATSTSAIGDRIVHRVIVVTDLVRFALHALVAAHGWDVSGALAAGCEAAFVARPGMVPSPLGPRPDVIGADLAEVAAQILARNIA